MSSMARKIPSFFIIGAQKAGTSWLWRMLDQHPGTSLPEKKEIHYFGSSEIYAKGGEWYYSHFDKLDPNKVIGEASTTYFYDRMPYWYNESVQIEYDDSLPLIPKLITDEFPDMKFIVVLRDPVHRAISAYAHWMKKGNLPPSLGLKKLAIEQAKTRILEYGFYARYLNVWKRYVPPDRLRVIIFEDQIKKNWNQTLMDTYEYLGLDPGFQAGLPNRPVHKSWGWTRIVCHYYASRFGMNIGSSRAGSVLDRFDILAGRAINAEDIEFLRSVYLPQKEEISLLTGNSLSCWDYGEGLLRL